MGFGAGSRSISRYLDEVIFAPLPPEVFDFLLHTSVLNRLHPDLCDAVCGRHNGGEMLRWIAQHNLFLSALDDSGRWFRYHPLMRDALLHRLRHGGDIDIASCTIAPAPGSPRSSCGPRRYAMRWPPENRRPGCGSGRAVSGGRGGYRYPGAVDTLPASQSRPVAHRASANLAWR
jgi:hypothetical protein